MFSKQRIQIILQTCPRKRKGPGPPTLNQKHVVKNLGSLQKRNSFVFVGDETTQSL